MSPEVLKPEFNFKALPDSQFSFPRVFVGTLISMGYPIRIGEPESLRDLGSAYVVGADRFKEVQAIQDKIDFYNITAILDSVGAGGSNEILFLLRRQEGKFYESYPGVTINLPIGKKTLERCFVRAYDEFLEYKDRDRLAKQTDFPKQAETQMYERLRAKEVSPISVSEMQRLLVPVILDARKFK